MPIVSKPSPNHDLRPAGKPVDILVLHYTGMATATTALDRLCDPQAKVSAHYTIDEDGTIYAHVPEDRRAWHAGVASWAGDSDVNGRSIGIELVNPGHEFGYRQFAEAQMAALVDLARQIVARHPIPRHRVVGHSDVAPTRKQDPGELFDWARLAAAGIGLWPATGLVAASGEAVGPGAAPAAVSALRGQLAAFGYGIETAAEYDETAAQVVTALQRHYRPARIDGVADGETRAILADLLRQCG